VLVVTATDEVEFEVVTEEVTVVATIEEVVV
jgi:hypothetical protein